MNVQASLPGKFFRVRIAPSLLAIMAFSLPGWAADRDTPAPLTFREEWKIPPEDRPVLEAFIGHAVKFASDRTPENVQAACLKSPESFAWVDFRFLNGLNLAYELTGDTTYLDQFRDTFGLYRAIMTTGNDHYLGWYGTPIPSRIPKDNPTLQVDEIQMNFRAMAILSRWVELAETNPEYAKKNAQVLKASRDLMENHLFPKWDSRGFFQELPAGRGIYRGLEFPVPPGVTLSHEKMAIVLEGLLGLHRATGKDVYLRRALQLGAFFKACLSVKDGHYEWMSWCPAGKWDVSPDKPDGWKVNWIAPDPNGEWYVSSLSMALHLYQHGLLFSDGDIARFVRTQKEMCWNGNRESPEYRNVAGVKNEHVKGRFLSLQLAHYDPVLKELAFSGPHEAEVQKNSASAWKGGANAQAYVSEKYLRQASIEADPRPDRKIGEAFLKDPANRAFYDQLFFDVKEPGAVTPLVPSQAGF